MSKKYFLFATTCIIALLFNLSTTKFTQAEEESTPANEEFHVNLDKDTIAKGYTVSAFDNKIKLILTPKILDQSTDVDVLIINEEIPTPWQLKKISPTYQFEFRNKTAYDNRKPFNIQISYNEANNDLKRVYFFDKNSNSWRPLPTKDFPKEKYVLSSIYLPYARIAVFSFPEILTSGQATWYAYKGGKFAASPDFPAGSILRVTNQDNKKSVDVTVNDWGPERDKFPKRVIDLDKVAFAKIASLRAGVINVNVEPIFIASSPNARELEATTSISTKDFSISAPSAIAIDEDSGKIIWKKNATSTRPLASLTKLIAVKVFLDTKPSLNQKIAYSKKDEEYNYKYCKPWESAKVKLDEGEELTYEDLVYSALVGSANNMIETIVRASGLSREDFIQKMNDSVKEWGATSTHFIEPTGLSPENVSSASDYALILKTVMQNPIIQKSSTMNRYTFTTINTKKKHTISNTNKIIQTNKFKFTGSKTGYLDEAGYCLATRILHAGKNIIAVTFGAATRDQSFSDTINLLKYAILKN